MKQRRGLTSLEPLNVEWHTASERRGERRPTLLRANDIFDKDFRIGGQTENREVESLGVEDLEVEYLEV